MVASYDHAYDVRGEVLAMVAKILRARPRGIGVVDAGNGRFGLKVSLAEWPIVNLPSDYDGIPLSYDVLEDAPALVGGAATVLDWRQRIRGVR
jgi:hypothetical protein